MEDKRKEEIKNKIDKINNLNGKIRVYEDLLEDATDTLDFLDIFQCHAISLAGYNDDGEYRENVLMPLSGDDMIEVLDLIEKKLENQISEHNDEILKVYQKLDELLK